MNNRTQGFKWFVKVYSVFIIFLILFSSTSSIYFSPMVENSSLIYSKNCEDNSILKYSATHFTNLNTRTRANGTIAPLITVTNDTVVYAIICPLELISTVEPLAAWKTRKGVPAKIYTTDGPDGIYANYPEGDNATKIHDFLTSLHENNSNLQWVLLVGDEDIIPSRLIFVNASELYGLDDYYYSDHYYAGLNNSWNQDSDDKYGEQKGDINWYANLYVGRLPVNNVSEANIAINKILNYEITPEIGPWMTNATFWSGLLDGPNNTTAYQSYKDNAIKVTNKILKYVPEYMQINHLYDYNELVGGNYSLKTDILNHSSAKRSFYDGNSIISFAGQAYYTADELANYIDGTGLSAAPDGFGALFSHNDGKYAYNGNKLPLLYLSTCSVNFSEPDDSNLEQLITAPNGGVIGLIGNSGKSYRGETENGSSYGNWWLNEQFWRLFFNNTYQPGKCLYKLKEKYVKEVIYFDPPYIQMTVANLVGYNLLGDPELSIWTDMPKELYFNYSLNIDNGYKLSVNVTDGNGLPVRNARVCVYSNSTENYEYGVTNSSGTVLINLDPRVANLWDITITAHNYLPKMSNFSYENKAPVLKQIANITLAEDETLENYLNLMDYVTDPDNLFEDLEIIIINNTNPAAGVVIDGYRQIDIRPEPNWHGEATITLQVSDGIAQVQGSFSVTVNPVNDPPVMEALIPVQEIKIGETFSYIILVTDVDNDNLTFSDDTKLFDIDKDTGEIVYKPSENDGGKYKITITASDGNASADQEFILEVIKEYSFLDLYWFPIAVIIGTVIFIIIVKLYSIKHPEREAKEERTKQKKEQVKKPK